MYDFARRPLWILSHVLVVVAVLVMVRLGFWQMSRWQDEQEALERIEAGLVADPVPLEELLADLGDPATTDEVDASAKYRRVTASGTWDLEGQVAIRNRSQGGQPGAWLVTPLVLADGSAVAVARGWMPLSLSNEGPPYEGTDPAAAEAVVTGVVQLTHQGGGLGPQDPEEGRLETLARVDLDRLGAQLGESLVPVWLELQESEPAQPDPPLAPVDTSLPSPSQNFSYMMQWWFFAAIAAGGYVLILRKVARTRSGSGGLSQVPVEDPPEPVDA